MGSLCMSKDTSVSWAMHAFYSEFYRRMGLRRRVWDVSRLRLGPAEFTPCKLVLQMDILFSYAYYL